MENENNTKPKNHKQIPGFIIDSSALKDMFEGKNKGHASDLLKKLKEMNDSGMKINAVTTLSSFLRAIYLSDPKVEIGKIQKTLSFLQVYSSFTDFKNEKDVRDEIMELAQFMSRSNDKRKRVFEAVTRVSNKLNKAWIREGEKANICICGLHPIEDLNKKITCAECKEDCYIASEDSEEVKSMKANNIKNICARCALLNHRNCLSKIQIKILEAGLSSQGDEGKWN